MHANENALGTSREFHRTIFIASRALKGMKAAAYQPIATRPILTASLVASSFFYFTTSSLHAPIGWYPILLCHGKIKRAFNAASHLGNPYDDHRLVGNRSPSNKDRMRFPMTKWYGARREISSFFLLRYIHVIIFRLLQDDFLIKCNVNVYA